MSESVIFEVRRVENGGVRPTLSILVLIFPYILIYTTVTIFTNFDHFRPILEPWYPFLGYLITLGVWKCYIRAQWGRKWGSRTKIEHPSPDISIYTDICYCNNFKPILTILDQFWSESVWKCYIRAQQGWIGGYDQKMSS